MRYSARYNTADPKIGAVSVGEILTEAQAQALGKKKITELVKSGLLIPLKDDGPAEENAAPAQETASSSDAAKDDEGKEAILETPEETDAAADEDEDAGIADQDDMSDIVQD